jgi:hypothetical protein
MTWRGPYLVSNFLDGININREEFIEKINLLLTDHHICDISPKKDLAAAKFQSSEERHPLYIFGRATNDLTPSRGIKEMDSRAWPSFIKSWCSSVEEGRDADLKRWLKYWLTIQESFLLRRSNLVASAVILLLCLGIGCNIRIDEGRRERKRADAVGLGEQLFSLWCQGGRLSRNR